MSVTLWTIGHSTRPAEQFVAMLAAHRIETLADVRTIPRSRRNPQYAAEALRATLETAGIAYVGTPGLGGFRRPRPDSANLAWRNEAFRGYADYMETAAFAAALRELLDLAAGRRTAVMCAEALPWRCHRSLLSDALVAGGATVLHIMTAGSADAHRLTPFARVRGSKVSYPPEQAGLPDPSAPPKHGIVVNRGPRAGRSA